MEGMPGGRVKAITGSIRVRGSRKVVPGPAGIDGGWYEGCCRLPVEFTVMASMALTPHTLNQDGPGVGVVALYTRRFWWTMLLILLLTFLFPAEILSPPLSSLKARPGVSIAGQDVGGLAREELLVLVARVADRYCRPPVNATLDRKTGGVIAGLNGWEVDIPATVNRILNASEGEVVSFAFRELKPQLTIDHFPQAPVYQGNGLKKEMALVINVAWGNEHLKPLLHLLDQYQVKGTFFIVGRWAEAFPNLVKEIAARGHEIGNHGYTDEELKVDSLTREEMVQQILQAGKVLAGLTGQKIRYFSPHKGESNRLLLETAAQLGYRTIFWSLDTVDWMRPGKEAIINRVLGNAHNGAIILIHPIDQTVEAMKEVIPAVQQQGYRLVTIPRLLSPFWLEPARP